MANKTIQHL